MVSRARAVSWSSMPASSTSRRSPGSSRARASGSRGRRGTSGRRRPSGSRAGGPARPLENASAPTCCSATRAAFRVGVTTTSRCSCISSSSRAAARVVVLPAPAAPSITSSCAVPASAATTWRWAWSRRRPATTVPTRSVRRGLLGACGEPGDEVGLDVEHLAGGEGADVLGYVVAGQQRHAPRDGAGGQVLGQLAAYRRRRRRRRRAAMIRSTSPRMSAAFQADRRAPSRDSDQVGHRVPVDPADRRTARCSTPRQSGE